ncbi:hypothetical protein [uncultured Clostridium sp.]|uniref:hypothetical protein n=1 Tax=uncultured Clostridium sp. TaxID=59620 RepID=UPI0026341BE8|nr:hypothetical protein [uncultured Clostridium sp.]
MIVVKVTLPKTIADRLKIIAKKEDFKTREEYLRFILAQIAQEEFQLESDRRYQNLIEEILLTIKSHEKTIEKNSIMLEKFYDKG